MFDYSDHHAEKSMWNLVGKIQKNESKVDCSAVGRVFGSLTGENHASEGGGEAKRVLSGSSESDSKPCHDSDSVYKSQLSTDDSKTSLSELTPSTDDSKTPLSELTPLSENEFKNP